MLHSAVECIEREAANAWSWLSTAETSASRPIAFLFSLINRYHNWDESGKRLRPRASATQYERVASAELALRGTPANYPLKRPDGGHELRHNDLRFSEPIDPGGVSTDDFLPGGR